MKRSFKGIIFDLDGTLLDTSMDLSSALNVVRAQFNLEPIDSKTMCTYMGDGLRLTLVRGLSPLKLDSYDEVGKQFLKAYAGCYNDSSQPYAGIDELLATLQEQGYRLAVLSNKMESFVKDLCADHFPDIHFEVMMGDHPQIKRKPDPSGILLIAEIMKLSPKDLLMVGDSLVDAQAARAAGASICPVAWGYQSPQLLSKEAQVEAIENPYQLFEHLDKL